MNIHEILAESGISKDDPEYGLQFNLTHASLAQFGIRNGLDPRVKETLRAKNLGGMTNEGLMSFVQLLDRLLDGGN